jgi:hypothetical protein
MSNPVVLSPERHKLLVSLKASAAIRGEEWQDVSAIHSRILNGLEEKGFITTELVGDKLKAKITPRGSVALRAAIVHGSPEYTKLRREKAASESALDNGADFDAEQINPGAAEVTAQVALAQLDAFDAEFDKQPFYGVVLHEKNKPSVDSAQDADCEDGCAAPCAHRRVLEMLMARNPKVRELLDHAIRLEKLLGEFDAD